MPETDSASCAVTAAIRVRTSANATCEVVWNHRVTTIPGGRTTSATTPRRQSSRNSPPTAATSVIELTTSVVKPWFSTSESASTSLVRRAMIQPAFCWEKYRSDSDVRCSKRSRRRSSTICCPIPASISQVVVPRIHAVSPTAM